MTQNKNDDEKLEFNYKNKFDVCVQTEFDIIVVNIENSDEYEGTYRNCELKNINNKHVLEIVKGTYIEVSEEMKNQIEDMRTETLEFTTPVKNRWTETHDGKHNDYYAEIEIEHEGEIYEITTRTDHYGHSVSLECDRELPDAVVDRAKELGRDDRAGF